MDKPDRLVYLKQSIFYTVLSGYLSLNESLLTRIDLLEGKMKIVVFCLYFFFGVFSSYVLAQPFANAQYKSNTLKVTSSRQAAQMVVSRFGGKVLKIQPKTSNGQQGYKVKLLKKSGNILTVFVNAKSGRLIRY